MQAYFKGILFHYYKEFPYFWKGNILENLNLLNKKISEVMLRLNLFKLAENILAEQCIMYFVKV